MSDQPDDRSVVVVPADEARPIIDAWHEVRAAQAKYQALVRAIGQKYGGEADVFGVEPDLSVQVWPDQ